MRDPRYDILFTPLKIGPVTTRNRFYQVPHCSGMGWRRPRALAAMRGVKAEGGWGVVNTEYCSIHPSSDNDAFPYAALWDAEDVAAHRLMTEAVHGHGALAGVELWIGGAMVVNFGTRIPAPGLRSRPQTDASVCHPGQTRRLDRADIRDIRRWHRDAARRALEAGFDILYVYATHGYLLSEFLNPETNTRSDEYGGSLGNRVRLVRELIEETKEVAAGRAAVACRFSVDLQDTETYDAFGLLADLPDLWDLTVNDYGIEMGSARFVKEAALAGSVARARALTDKPVVAVGRFTSPDTMARQIADGVQDLIGAARPSIADPFLPRKIEEGRIDDIRECIGCNICYAHDSLGVPIRCTQNPTMGEEWRLGWHPERVGRAEAPARVLVVGAGPSGLEAARVLGARGHSVLLAEARRELGGRVSREARLPGLAETARVRDWRLGQIAQLPGVEIFRESRMTARDVCELGARHVLIATGARWSSDAVGRHSDTGFDAAEPGMILNAETVLDGVAVQAGRITIYDDDHHYIGPVLALELRRRGHQVVLVTPQGRACAWGVYTTEQEATIRALLEAGIEIRTNRRMTAVAAGQAQLACVFTGDAERLDCDAVIPLTRRQPVDDLYRALRAEPEALDAAGIRSVQRIGDAEAPSLIAAAVYSGYRAAMALGETGDPDARHARREHPPSHR
ncbi:MAG: FAD-dependent oxidoreductase [Sedimentitalea sp.]|nr:FAD-dependent oxidoreductase [Sedimentitalea sp.]